MYLSEFTIVTVLIKVLGWSLVSSLPSSAATISCYMLEDTNQNCNSPSCFKKVNNTHTNHCIMIFTINRFGHQIATTLHNFDKTWVQNPDYNAHCPKEPNGKCIGFKKTDQLYFCCCTGHLCNNPLTIKYSSFSKSASSIAPVILESPKPVVNAVFIMKTAACSLLPLLLLSLIVIFIYYIYRKRKVRAERNLNSANWGDSDPLVSQGHGDGGKKHSLMNGMVSCSSPQTAYEMETGLDENSMLPNGSKASEAHKRRCLDLGQPYWRLGSVLVNGHMSCVQRCSLISNDGCRVIREAVLKTLLDQNLWRNETDIYHVPGLQHKNIVEFITAEQPCPGIYWLVVASQPMGNVHDFLQTRTLSWREALKVCSGLAQGLHHLHEDATSTCKPPIAHRDIKSKNVLLGSDLTPRIADFGLALQLPQGLIFNRIQSQVGTRRYMSPELLQGMIGFDRQAFLSVDVYSTGLVLWEILSRTRVPLTSTGDDLEDAEVAASMPEVERDEDVPAYRAPYSAELGGAALTLVNLAELVWRRRDRPKPREIWDQNENIKQLWRTVQECWESDSEARLSAGCIAERTTRLLGQLWPEALSNDERDSETSVVYLKTLPDVCGTLEDDDSARGTLDSSGAPDRAGNTGGRVSRSSSSGHGGNAASEYDPDHYSDQHQALSLDNSGANTPLAACTPTVEV